MVTNVDSVNHKVLQVCSRLTSEVPQSTQIRDPLGKSNKNSHEYHQFSMRIAI